MSHIDEGELTAYADGAFAPDEPEAQHIAAHLAECANCRNVLTRVQQTSARAQEILAIASPDVIVVPALPRRRSLFVPMAWAASLVFAVGLGYLSRDLMQTHMTTTPQKPPVAVSVPEVVATTPPPPVIKETPRRRTESRPLAEKPAAEVATAVAAGAGAAAPMAQAAAPPSARDMAVAPAMDTLAIPGLEIVSVEPLPNGRIIKQKLTDDSFVRVIITGPEMSETKSLAASEMVSGNAARKAELKVPEAVLTRGLYTIRVRGPLSIDSLNALARKIK